MNNVKDKKNDHVDRRRFLATSATIGSSLLLPTGTQSQTNDINIAIIGAGTQGQALLMNCLTIPGVKIKAICDIWENYALQQVSRLLARFSIDYHTYTDYREMLSQENDLDAVIIATPDFCHAEQSIACLKAGKHVYCESVMATTIDDARQMSQTATDTGKLLQIGFQRRSNPQYKYAYNHIINETKLVGKITAMNGQWNRAVQPSRGWPRRAPLDEAILNQFGYESMDQFRNWPWFKKFGGGPVTAQGSHQIDIFTWYMDTPPSSLMASGGIEYYDDSRDWFDTLMSILEYQTPKGTVRGFYQNINANSNFGHYENFMGDEGTLYMSETPSRVKVYREPSAPDWNKWVQLGILKDIHKKEEPKNEASSNTVLEVQETVLPPTYDLPVVFTDLATKPHLENFVNAIHGKEPLNCPAEKGFVATVCALKLNEAAATGKIIPCTASDFTI
jgi:predicted dehydrogenase